MPKTKLSNNERDTQVLSNTQNINDLYLAHKADRADLNHLLISQQKTDKQVKGLAGHVESLPSKVDFTAMSADIKAHVNQFAGGYRDFHFKIRGTLGILCLTLLIVVALLLTYKIVERKYLQTVTDGMVTEASELGVGEDEQDAKASDETPEVIVGYSQVAL